jgi:hypothetical protein
MVNPDLLSHEAITEIHAMVGEYTFRLRNLRGVLIRIKTWETNAVDRNRFTYTISHHVHGPNQINPYYPSYTYSHDEKSTLDSAINDLLAFWPSDEPNPHKEWLVPNEDFSSVPSGRMPHY